MMRFLIIQRTKATSASDASEPFPSALFACWNQNLSSSNRIRRLSIFLLASIFSTIIFSILSMQAATLSTLDPEVMSPTHFFWILARFVPVGLASLISSSGPFSPSVGLLSSISDVASLRYLNADRYLNFGLRGIQDCL